MIWPQQKHKNKMRCPYMFYCCAKTAKEILVAYVILFWIFIIGVNLTYFASSSTQTPFYNIGPNENLVVLNIRINTPFRYFAITVYSILNNIVRNLNNNILSPWITHNIQDNTEEAKTRKISLDHRVAHIINVVNNIYRWFDFLIYIHLLLSQIDLFLIESCSDVIIVTVITQFWYLSPTNTQHVMTDLEYETVYLNENRV
jgi:hypothetical protein